MRTGATRGRAPGRGCEVDYLLDGGAYATLSPVVLFRGDGARLRALSRAQREGGRARGAHAHRPLRRLPRLRRAAGGVRAARARWTVLAERLGMDPLELRRRNALRRRATRRSPATSCTASVGFREVLDKVAAAVGLGAASARPSRATRARCAAGSAWPPATTASGLGAMGKHLNPAGASVVVAADGSVTVAVGTTEIGQGMITVLSQIAAEALGCPVELVQRGGGRHLARARQRAHRGQPHDAS